ncbi:MAG: HAD-IB family phosphatase [Clostridia bacterium]|nr:HAD-IB family phosphatase [Clostridia bacterium]
MNVYDFDGTIYNGDSGVDFIKFSYFKKPAFMSVHLLKCLKYLALYKLKKIDFRTLKEYIFSFVSTMNQLEKLTLEFAQSHKYKVKKYYQDLKAESDLIISASLDFYLIPLCNEIGIQNVICTKYDVKNGKIIGENCKLEEKVKRFEEKYGKDATIDNAYGDSKSDIPMLKRAKNGFMVKGEKLCFFGESSL